MRLKKGLLSLVLSLVLVTLLLSPAPVVSASTSSTLYGTGSADEINIVKLLDMALNKGGMSMSPATIKAFLEFWWSSVQADLNTCISNADSAITTTQDFVDYVYTALEDTEHYEQLGDIIKRYVRFVLTLDYKSLSDFKQLLTQQGTFRQFLLSYVTDQDGNIADTVDNKIKKYNIGKDFVNMARKAAEAYIEEYEGYWLVPTFTYKDISPSICATREYYETITAMLKKIPDGGLYAFYVNKSLVLDLDYPNLHFVNNSYSYPDRGAWDAYLYNDNWQQINRLNSSEVTASGLDQFPSMLETHSLYAGRFSFNSNMVAGPTYYNIILFTKDGFSVKIWKSLDAFKASSVGQSNVYYSSDYFKYDSSVDNSIEFSGSYYNSSSSSYSHDIIQNTIDNSSEVNESTVNNIVNNYITNNNYGDSSSSGSGSGSGNESGSDNWWNIGDGITAFVKGVAALLDFLLKLLGDLIGVISDFLVGLLEILKNLAVVGSSFGDFLGEFFGFLPDEIIYIIVSGIGLMVVAGVIKAFKK